MADETKITLKIGIIASGIATLILFVFGCLWDHQSKITVLGVNQSHIMKRMDKIDDIADVVSQIRNDQLRRERLEKKR